jgi:hypothetical protein
VLTAIDINTNTVAGTLNLHTLMGGGMSFGRESLDQATWELVFANRNYDKFLIVNGAAVTGSRGRAPAWNTAEHKIYITTIAWNGHLDAPVGNLGRDGFGRWVREREVEPCRTRG